MADNLFKIRVLQHRTAQRLLLLNNKPFELASREITAKNTLEFLWYLIYNEYTTIPSLQ